MEFLCDLASKIRKKYQETYLSNKISCQSRKELISAKKKGNDMLPNYHVLFFKKTALQDPALDRSVTFLSLAVQGFLNFIRKDQFHLMST